MSKKPAKKVSPTTVSAPKIDDGYQVLYIGATPSVRHKCPECGKITGKGMLRQYKDAIYCSRGCVMAHKASEEVPA